MTQYLYIFFKKIGKHVYIMIFKWKVILLNKLKIKMFARSVNQHLYNVIRKSPVL